MARLAFVLGDLGKRHELFIVDVDQVVQLVPGGYHIMLIDLAKPLVVGETFDLTLDFDQAPDLTVTIEVSDR